MTQIEALQLVEVSPRDGFQSIDAVVPTSTKIRIIEGLYEAGIRRMEVTSFVSASAVPQLADAAEIVATAKALPGLDAQVLVPTARHADRALAAGANHLCAVLSVSARHNLSNLRREPMESVADYAQIVALAAEGVRIRLNVATAFHCPYEGNIAAEAVLDLLEHLVAIKHDVEIALCDTTGRANPRQVGSLFTAAADRFPQVMRWAFHGHDTFGLGAANVLSAYTAGIRVFDSSAAGLGGCPFAPGATGNVATEDLVWMFDGMGVPSGIDLDRLIGVAGGIVDLPGAQVGGRVRDAVTARACRTKGRGA